MDQPLGLELAATFKYQIVYVAPSQQKWWSLIHDDPCLAKLDCCHSATSCARAASWSGRADRKKSISWANADTWLPTKAWCGRSTKSVKWPKGLPPACQMPPVSCRGSIRQMLRKSKKFPRSAWTNHPLDPSFPSSWGFCFTTTKGRAESTAFPKRVSKRRTNALTGNQIWHTNVRLISPIDALQIEHNESITIYYKSN